MQQYHNVSVRLTSQEYKDLMFLHDRFNKGLRIGKVTTAEIIREALKDMHLAELKLMDKEEKDKTVNMEKLIEEKALELLKQQQKKAPEKVEVKEETKAPEQVEEEFLTSEQVELLQQFEEELRKAKNSKNKPFGEQYIKKELNKRKKELLTGSAENALEETAVTTEEGTEETGE